MNFCRAWLCPLVIPLHTLAHPPPSQLLDKFLQPRRECTCYQNPPHLMVIGRAVTLHPRPTRPKPKYVSKAELLTRGMRTWQDACALNCQDACLLDEMPAHLTRSDACGLCMVEPHARSFGTMQFACRWPFPIWNGPAHICNGVHSPKPIHSTYSVLV